MTQYQPATSLSVPPRSPAPESAAAQNLAQPRMSSTAPGNASEPLPMPSAGPAPDPAPHPGSTRLRMVPIPRLAAHGRWRVEAMRSLTEPMLLWFTRGQGRITVSGVTRGYGPHNAIFLPAGVMHAFEVSAHVFGTAVFFGTDCGLPLPESPLHLRIRDQQPQAELSGILDNIHRELDGGRPGSERAAGHHLGLLGVWIERQIAAQEDLPAPDAAARLVARFTALVERDFRSGLGVAEYSAALGVTATHLTRVCRQCCDRSAHAIMQERVLFEARKLLKETELPVGEVSRQLGFTSAAYFTRAFQHAVGKTPSAFRRGE